MDKRAPYPRTQVEFLLFYDRGTRCHNPFGRSGFGCKALAVEMPPELDPISKLCVTPPGSARSNRPGVF